MNETVRMTWLREGRICWRLTNPACAVGGKQILQNGRPVCIPRHRGRTGRRSSFSGAVGIGRESSFLISIDALRKTVEEVGFQIESLEDTSEEALAWRRSQPVAAGLAPSILGIHVVMGEQFHVMQSNQVRNLEQRRLTYVRGVASKPKTVQSAAEQPAVPGRAGGDAARRRMP